MIQALELTEGYYLRCRRTGALTHGPFPQLHCSFEHYVPGQNEVVHRRANGEVNIASK